MKLLLALILCLFTSLGTYAQLPDYHVQLFDESFGVRTSEVRKVIVDKAGFVWIMHEDRIQHFDGKQIIDFVIDENMMDTQRSHNSDQVFNPERVQFE